MHTAHSDERRCEREQARASFVDCGTSGDATSREVRNFEIYNFSATILTPLLCIE